eukprot:Skav215605  [mRNA]  locus=scaffold666:451844:452945:- [translate_table: standard]
MSEEEAEPERTPESDLDALWQKAEAVLKQRRAAALDERRNDAPKAVPGPWSRYKGLGSRGSGGRDRDSDSCDLNDRLWKDAELEIQRRRAMASGKGFRLYDISDAKGRGKDGKGYHARPSYPSKSAESSWKDTLQRHGASWKIFLDGRQMDDGILIHWCKWAKTHLNRLPANAVVSIVDVSNNRITATGLQALLRTLTDADVRVEGRAVAKLAVEIAQLKLLEAAVKALQSPLELVSGGRPNVRYPCDRQGQRVPLWLRLHHNRIGEGRGPAQVRAFLQGMEHELLAARRQAGLA